MSDTRELLRRGVEGFEPMPDAFERVLARRDRKRRNQRIAAGVVGIAVFVAAIWMVTSGLSLDRSEKSVAPAGTGPVQTGPPRAPSSAPDVVSQGECSAGASSRLELTYTGEAYWEEVRFEVHRSPVGHSWHIVFRHLSLIAPPHALGLAEWEGTRVASDSGDLVANRRIWDLSSDSTGGLFKARAVDTKTGQVCKAQAAY